MGREADSEAGDGATLEDGGREATFANQWVRGVLTPFTGRVGHRHFVRTRSIEMEAFRAQLGYVIGQRAT